jgi:hypothetical protein
MAALEAEAEAAVAAAGRGTAVKGFVSAGIIQQGNDKAAGGKGGLQQPGGARNAEELDVGDVGEAGEGMTNAGGRPPSQIRAADELTFICLLYSVYVCARPTKNLDVCLILRLANG